MTQDLVLPGPPPITVALRRSARARRLSLRVSALDGRATLTLPTHSAQRTAVDFLRQQEAWLRAQLAGRPESVVPAPGGYLPVEGRLVPIIAEVGAGAGARGAARLHDGALIVPGEAARVAVRLRALLIEMARARLQECVTRHALTLGLSHSRLTLRDPRSRWGSCSQAGGLMFSWRLIMAPPEVLDYVAAHEVAHLAEMNHAPAFWAVVARLCPGHRAARDWLKREGSGLHRYDFTGC